MIDFRYILPRGVEILQEQFRHISCILNRKKKVIDAFILEPAPAKNELELTTASLVREKRQKLPAVWLYEIQNAKVKELFVTKWGIVQSRISCQGPIYPKKREMLKNVSIKTQSESVDTAIWVLDKWSTGYFHWLTEALCRLLVISKHHPTYPILVPFFLAKSSPLVALMEAFGLEVKCYDENETLVVKRLFSVDFLAPSGRFNPHIICELRDKFRELYASSETNENAEVDRIYISREFAEKRKANNQTEMNALVEEWGIRKLKCEEMSFDEQIKAMSKCELLVGEHGAGLSNMLFAPSGCKVFEIRNKYAITDNFYYNLAVALGLDYYLIEAEGSSSHPHNSDFDVDIEALRDSFHSAFGVRS